MTNDPRISICIPAYNRPSELLELLESIQKQKYQPFEVIICEDNSPERLKIREVVEYAKKNFRFLIKYFENRKNLGYDSNLRKVISLASGDYVFLSGNDDILSGNSLQVVAEKIIKYSPYIIIRSYASFYKNLIDDKTVHRYVSDDYITNFSLEEAAWLFYRSVLVSGLVFKCGIAKDLQSKSVDGTLYYQNYLLTKIFVQGPALYVPDVLVYNRLLDAGDFGSSEIEAKGDWVPGKRTIKSSVYQMSKFFECAEKVQSEININFSPRLKVIASAYSYSLVAYHADKPFFDFISYIRSLRKIGYGGVLFYLYAVFLKILGIKICNILLNKARVFFGFTRRLV